MATPPCLSLSSDQELTISYPPKCWTIDNWTAEQTESQQMDNQTDWQLNYMDSLTVNKQIRVCHYLLTRSSQSHIHLDKWTAKQMEKFTNNQTSPILSSIAGQELTIL